MELEKLEKWYGDRGYPYSTISVAKMFISECHDFLLEDGKGADSNQIIDIDTCTGEDMERYVEFLVENNENSMERLFAMARYFLVTDNKPLYIYFTSIFGSVGVVDEIRKRIINFFGMSKANEVFQQLIVPELGTSALQMSGFTSKFMQTLNDYFTVDELKQILAGNNHQIPVEAMLKEKEYFLQAKNIDVYLKGRHERKVGELERYRIENKIWFEQEVTREVVDYVRSNQEILSAVRVKNKLYITKIPYDTSKFLSATDDRHKCYYACHCPFVREALLEGDTMDSNWCYCSAGFAKFPFEVMMDENLKVKVIETPLKGDLRCRFEVKIPNRFLP